MNLTFATRDMIRALRVLAPALSRSNQDRIYACQLVAQGPTAVIRALNDTWEARSAIPATIEGPGEVWLPADTLRRLPWGTLGETVRIRRVKAGLEIQSQSPTSETFTAEIMGPAATKGLPRGPSGPPSNGCPPPYIDAHLIGVTPVGQAVLFLVKLSTRAARHAGSSARCPQIRSMGYAATATTIAPRDRGEPPRPPYVAPSYISDISERPPGE